MEYAAKYYHQVQAEIVMYCNQDYPQILAENSQRFLRENNLISG